MLSQGALDPEVTPQIEDRLLDGARRAVGWRARAIAAIGPVDPIQAPAASTANPEVDRAMIDPEAAPNLAQALPPAHR